MQATDRDTFTFPPETLAQVTSQLAPADASRSDEEISRAIWMGMMVRTALTIAAGRPVSTLEDLPASKGYEPLLIENGRDKVAARGVAALARRHGRRRATEAKSQRPAFDAIRFLAQPGRQTRSVRSRAKRLLTISEETSIIETAFHAARIPEHEFLHLLKSSVEGMDVDLLRLSAIAQQVLPHLRLVRGPKVSAASAAHEFLKEAGPELNGLRSSQPRIRGRVHFDALTRATQSEFENPNFDSRPAVRRLKRRRPAAEL
jgi:hypothetical protein